MKRVINGLVYNTDTAEKLHDYQSPENPGDFKYFEQTLYRTQKGNHFLTGEGGPMSPYAESLGGGSWGGGSGITPLTLEEAAEWLEQHEGHDVLLEDPTFQNLIEEA